MEPDPRLEIVDGRALAGRERLECDVAIVGSGPAGAAAARVLARAGARVVVVEEGPYVAPDDYPTDGFTAMARLFRDMGASVALGNAPLPFLQGRVVGGGSVINGAISWPMPRWVHEDWVARDPPLAEALPWEEIVAVTADLERDLDVAPTAAAIAGPNNLLLGKGAEALGLAHQPIARYVRGCQGLGRCLQGCPVRRKRSMDRTFLPDACAAGARILAAVEATGVVTERAVATGVRGRAAGGGRVEVAARRAVILAASAVQTPALLLASGIDHGPVGDFFQGHPGVSMAGRFPEPVRIWTGATQGHEVTSLVREGIKFDALGYDLAVAAARLKGIGRSLAAQLADLDHWAGWAGAIRAQGTGRVRPGRRRARVRFDFAPADVLLLRRAVRLLGEMMLAAGAEYVTPGIHGWHEQVSDRAAMARFEDEGPLDPKAYPMALTHMFGTCRLGSNPRTSVVAPDFRHHAIDRLYVADSSVFPGCTGVNPQTTIMALATLCARRVAA